MQDAGSDHRQPCLAIAPEPSWCPIGQLPDSHRADSGQSTHHRRYPRSGRWQDRPGRAGGRPVLDV